MKAERNSWWQSADSIKVRSTMKCICFNSLCTTLLHRGDGDRAALLHLPKCKWKSHCMHINACETTVLPTSSQLALLLVWLTLGLVVKLILWIQTEAIHLDHRTGNTLLPALYSVLLNVTQSGTCNSLNRGIPSPLWILSLLLTRNVLYPGPTSVTQHSSTLEIVALHHLMARCHCFTNVLKLQVTLLMCLKNALQILLYRTASMVQLFEWLVGSGA